MPPMSDVRVVLCTFPNQESARQIGTLLIERQYAACVNLIPAIESIYRWQDQVQADAEVLAIIKTTAAGLPALEAELNALHPYDVPEFIALEPVHVATAYAQWLGEAVGHDG